ncbi:MAG: PD-(D/E)XK nuclease family protein [Deltaproteobacteria bacterium]|nr:PD-(D/E)XK nuclease family protein [Deltaproteobacteria bacterium]
MNDKEKDIIAIIKAGIPVLTVNTRLSRYLRASFDSEMQVNGVAAWPTPVVMPLFSWIESLWNESRPDRPLLSGTRAQALWERVVSSDRFLSKEIIMNSGLASTAYDAYTMIREYRITLPDDIYLTEEAKALKRLAEAYEKEVDRLGFIEQASLPGRVIELIKGRSIAVPDRVVFAGFDEIPPQMESLINGIEGNGGRVEFWPEHNSQLPTPNSVIVREYPDEVEEVIQAARWARKTWRPGMRIGFIVPDLERYKKIIEREFTSELNPEAVFPWKDTNDVFNISLGSPLSGEPLIKMALDILSIGEEAVDINKISAVLLSPYFAGSDEEYLSMARLDATLKKEGRFIVSLAGISRIIDRNKMTSLSGFRKRMDKWVKALSESRKRDLPSRWSGSLSNLLKNIEFPSKRYTLSSSEYQVLKGWNGLLEGLASLDEVLGQINRSEAVSHLAKTAGETIHQPESGERPIQVMGLLESSGLCFDHIWILGAHSDAFPAQPSPNPFIPLFVQKRHNLPHSTPERELEFSKRLLHKLFNSAELFEVSFPKVVDRKEVFVSPLFDPLENSPLKKCDAGGFINDSSRIKDAAHSGMATEDMPMDADIPPGEEELGMITGGTSIIKDQSWCPFRAFAIHRLDVSGIDTPGLGLSLKNRGSILHATLKVFWDRVGGSDGLKTIIANNELDRYIKDAVTEAFKRYYPIEPLSERYLELEQERVLGVLREWIEGVESNRGGFIVEKTEYKTDIPVEGLIIKARLDRIDSVNDGKKIIIDYKTGGCSKSDWLTERPKEPQLLVYNHVDSFDAISFAKVKPGDCGFTGISKEDDTLPKVVSFEKDVKLREKLQGINTWDELTESWKGVVNSLARQFMEGKNAADPIERACDYCDLKGLCRIFEAGTGHDKE